MAAGASVGCTLFRCRAQLAHWARAGRMVRAGEVHATAVVFVRPPIQLAACQHAADRGACRRVRGLRSACVCCVAAGCLLLAAWWRKHGELECGAVMGPSGNEHHRAMQLIWLAGGLRQERSVLLLGKSVG
jgi:hypothetical protein